MQQRLERRQGYSPESLEKKNGKGRGSQKKQLEFFRNNLILQLYRKILALSVQLVG